MRIVIGAMARSGSTWTFNAVRRLAIEKYGLEKVNAADNRLFKPIPDMDVEIIKTHATDGQQLPADVVITCIRDIRDAFTSAVAAGIVEVAGYTRNGFNQCCIDAMELLFVSPSYFWSQHADVVVRFEDLFYRKLEMLKWLGNQIWPEHRFEDDRLRKIAIVLDLMPHVYGDGFVGDAADERGFLHGDRHIQGIGVYGHINYLPVPDAAAIETAFPQWFEYFNYPLTTDYQEIEELLYE